MDITQERADFEAFASKHGLCVTEGGDLYRSHVVAWMWKAWQARAVLQSQDREDAGMAEIVREAAQIIAAIPSEHAPDNIRWPIVDELEGFASKIDHARRVEEEGM